MTPAFKCAVTAGFLESGRIVSHAANVAGLVAGLGCWWMRGVGLVFLFLSAIAWIVQTWFAARIAIDRSLFQTLAGDPDSGPAALDSLLVDWGILKQARQRSLDDRSQRARGLLRKQSLAFVVQLVMLGCTAVLGTVGI